MHPRLLIHPYGTFVCCSEESGGREGGEGGRAGREGGRAGREGGRAGGKHIRKVSTLFCVIDSGLSFHELLLSTLSSFFAPFHCVNDRGASAASSMTLPSFWTMDEEGEGGREGGLGQVLSLAELQARVRTGGQGRGRPASAGLVERER